LSYRNCKVLPNLRARLAVTEATDLELFSPPAPTERSLRLGISLIAIAATVALLYYGRDFFVTLIISAVFAFILDPAVQLVMKLRLPRPAATGIVIGAALIGVVLLSTTIWTQLSSISEELPTYASRLSELWGRTNSQLDEIEKRTIARLLPQTLLTQSQQIQQKPQDAMKARRRRGATPAQTTPPPPPAVQEVRIHADERPLIVTIYRYTSGYFHQLVMASFVPFLVYFMLSWRDHISKSFMRLFHGERRIMVGRAWSGIGHSTRAYVLGNFLLWVFLSSLSAVAFFLLGLPYWPLVGPLSACFSLLPYVGLPLSIVPPVLAAVAVPIKLKIVLTLVAITAGLHLIAINLLYPKVVGRRVRLNPLIVTVAIMFWGVIWGAVGLILAIPITAAVKTACDNIESLEPIGRLLGD
jgi:predicted PurR-regulated permease PerM